MPDDESTSFDPIADFYDQSAAPMFADEVVTPVVDLLAELAGSGRALELGIGTGRIALPLAARGVSVSGIDASVKMVEKLREKPGGAAIPVVIGDFATASVEGEFSLAFAVFNAIWNLRTQDKQVACFENVARHLQPGGHFVIELFVPDLLNISPGHNIRPIRADTNGMSFDVYDVIEQRLTSHHYWIGRQGMRSFASEGRYVWPAELDLMAQIAGMKLSDRWGGWMREPFTESSRSHVSVYATV
jgi:SAM-dependent methyltransferase